MPPKRKKLLGRRPKLGRRPRKSSTSENSYVDDHSYCTPSQLRIQPGEVPTILSKDIPEGPPRKKARQENSENPDLAMVSLKSNNNALTSHEMQDTHTSQEAIQELNVPDEHLEPLEHSRNVGPCYSKETKDSSSQKLIEFDNIKSYSNTEVSKLKRRLLLNYITKDDTSAKFYSGLTLFNLAHLFSQLKDKASRLNYWKGPATETVESQRGQIRDLSLYEQYLLTLMILRRGIDIQHAADIFGVSISVVSRTFITWINYLALELQFMTRWPEKKQILRKLPKSFRKHFPRTRAIIDCMEIYVEKPRRPTSQRRTRSSKHHNTYKALVSVTPRGVLDFVGELWSGNTSNKEIVQSSGILPKIEHGDDVMADRGFLIRGLLAQRGASMNIPPVANGRRLSASVTKTRRIAKARIHVERAIGRLKNFNILSGVMPIYLQGISNQVLQVCGALCNMDTVLNK